MVSGLEVRDLVVAHGTVEAVRGVRLRVAPGEVLALVGPSGCGKTSLLRAVAGLDEPRAGSVAWDGRPLDAVPAHRRGFGLMFQDHALFPHLDVGDNVAYGLRVGRREGRAAAARRVGEVLDLVGLAGFERRTVDSLSGGEAQRVALARALAPTPRLLMLDEPLGSLDRTLRERLADDLRRVLAAAGVAAILVTHDQEEAYAVADRLAVMRAGRLVRDGAAADVWRNPGSPFVARFLGHANVLASGDASGLGLGSASVVVPEAAVALAAPDAPGALPATVVDVRFRGPTSRVRLAFDAGPTLALHLPAPPAPGTRLGVVVDRGAVVALDPDEDGVAAASDAPGVDDDPSARAKL